MLILLKRCYHYLIECPIIGNSLRGHILSKKMKYCGTNFSAAPYVHIEWISNLSCGDNVSLNRFTWINAYGNVQIGDNVLIGPFVVIHSANHKFPRNDLIRKAGYDIKPVIVGENVWIGAHVTILPGVTIGDGAVVAAGAVVTKDIEPYTVVGGVPARKIKDRI